MKLVLLVKLDIISVSTPDRKGLYIYTDERPSFCGCGGGGGYIKRPSLFVGVGGGGRGYIKRPSLFVKRWLLFEYNSFEHAPNSKSNFYNSNTLNP